LTRRYLGVHYPSDVLAGAALGTLVATVWPR
jgi:membrane-associated phospholipid phosphatase